MSEKIAYIDKIIEISRVYLKESFSSKERLDEFLCAVDILREKINKKSTLTLIITK